MVNSREKGKRIERWFATELRYLFPNVQRNAAEQARAGGIDLLNTPPFDFECKGGVVAHITKVRQWIDQVKTEGDPKHFKAVLVKPDREEAYVIMPFADYKTVIETFLDTDPLR